jgi:hypothetical protein
VVQLTLTTLSVALNYQQFMTSFKPHGRRTALVPLEVAWTVPPAARIVEMQASTGPLPAEGGQVLGSYRAPKRGF